MLRLFSAKAPAGGAPVSSDHTVSAQAPAGGTPGTVQCSECGARIADSDVIGLNRKLIDEDVQEFMCLDCMAKDFGCTTEDLEIKIYEFKEEGCRLFNRKQSWIKRLFTRIMPQQQE